MVPATTYLVGFSGEIIWPLGQVSLLVKIGNEEYSTSAWMNFMVVRSHSPYNGIIGRPGVRNDLRALFITQQLCWVDQSTERMIHSSNSSRISEQTIAIGLPLAEEGRKMPVRFAKAKKAPGYLSLWKNQQTWRGFRVT
ncbi:hypothetical protein Tco_0891625 [Tanacetum coccineum]|uniref:Uncharacterized protein n=1 Tax=Tanacetum coccineum TaxID=301880 RepID=A0ABQ5C6R4_9ASTR